MPPRPKGVRIARPEDTTPQDQDFIDVIPEGYEDSPVSEESASAFQAPAEPRPSLEELSEPNDVENEAQKNQDRLNKFLSAKDRSANPETKIYNVKSLGTTVIVRELTNREAEDVFEMYQGVATGERNRKRVTEINAHLIAKALVEPNLRNPLVLAKLQEKFGHDLTLPDLILNIFKPGEIIQLGDAIMTLSGTEEDAITEAKN